MGHIQDFEAEVRKRIVAIEPGREPEELVAWLKEQVLKSYKNGLATRALDGKGVSRPVPAYPKK